MGYIRCPGCGGMNRDTDSKCYSCETELTAEGAPPPPSVVEEGAEPPPAPVSGRPPVATVAPGVAASDRKSTVLHGLRSGAIGGAMVGSVLGVIVAMFGGLFGMAFTNSWSGGALVGAAVFLAVLIEQTFRGVVIGAVLGAIDELCYAADAARVGFYVGIAFGVISMFTGNGGLIGTLLCGLLGSLTGLSASWAERRLFRKQHVDF
ncbi:MAG: hypothetical protein AB1758_25400 [Candidatus Eremiobacterota bacterium]